MIFVSTRRMFGREDAGWSEYASWIALPHLREVRTIDAMLNEYVDGCGDTYCEPAEIQDALSTLPGPRSPREYYLLATRVDADGWTETFDGFVHLGCDLSDETMTSSLLNCGPWTGALHAFVGRLNAFGLLSVDDARQAQKLLPAARGAEEPHAHADLWALFGRMPSPEL